MFFLIRGAKLCPFPFIPLSDDTLLENGNTSSIRKNLIADQNRHLFPILKKFVSNYLDTFLSQCLWSNNEYIPDKLVCNTFMQIHIGECLKNTLFLIMEQYQHITAFPEPLLEIR